MNNIIRVRVNISGHVQGVGFRWFVQNSANNFGVCGWVENLDNGDVLIEAQAEKGVVESFLEHVKTGHSYASVEILDVKSIPVVECENDFNINDN